MQINVSVIGGRCAGINVDKVGCRHPRIINTPNHYYRRKMAPKHQMLPNGYRRSQTKDEVKLVVEVIGQYRLTITRLGGGGPVARNRGVAALE